MSLALGALAASSGLAMVIISIFFSVTLHHYSSPEQIRVMAIVSSTFSAITFILYFLLLVLQLRFFPKISSTNAIRTVQPANLLAGVSGFSGIISSAVTALLLGILKTRDSRKLQHPTHNLVTAAFILWAISLISQCLIIFRIYLLRHRATKEQFYGSNESAAESSELSDMKTTGKDHSSMNPYEPKYDLKPTLSADSCRSKVHSVPELKPSLRSSLNTMSKARLVPPAYLPHHGKSFEMSLQEIKPYSLDGPESRDRFGGDISSRAVMDSYSSFPLPRYPDPIARCLETIPASPTDCSPQSSAFPSSPQPSKSSRRSRSYSPGNSNRELNRMSRAITTADPSNESHIHPLFRTDSSTPPPATTPGTIVTAAPGAGKVISDRASIRSLKSIKSGPNPLNFIMPMENF